MRYKYQGTVKDGNGRVIGSETTSDGNAASIAVYLTGTSTAASIYAASTGGTAVNSVSSGEYGLFEFWVDDTDYDKGQLFDITITHASFESQTYEDLDIFKASTVEVDTTAAGAGTDGTISSRSASALGECDGFAILYDQSGNKIYVPYWSDITP